MFVQTAEGNYEVRQGRFQWHNMYTKFNHSLSCGSQVKSCGRTDKQTSTLCAFPSCKERATTYKPKAVPLHAMMALGGERRYTSYSFSTSALDGGEWSASRLGCALVPGKGPPGSHCTGGWAGPRAGLDTEVRGKILSPLPGIEPRSSGRPARSQTLYWLSYPAHNLQI
jgi:hypothetical protein